MRKTSPFLLATLCTFSAQYGHAHSHTYIVEQPVAVVVQPAPVLIVESEPPAEIEDVMAPCPGDNYYWIKGHWQWNGTQWVRASGRWVVRPYASAAWVPGTWVREPHHWHWVEGYWR